ncbi:hypothetical protein FOCC_FOCC015391 [Frankliniella occidentalis]|nr:hypothetical protein FOCC_FOCC015391 [Frankliniella occidentalis]
MVLDQRREVRELAVDRILKARQNTAAGARPRKFKVPTINFLAEDYTDLVFWDQTPVHPPPILADVSDDDLRAAVSSDHPLDVLPLPCHTQAVERMVKNVTQASASVVGEDRREGQIRAAIRGRASMPKFNSKSAFKAPREG